MTQTSALLKALMEMPNLSCVEVRVTHEFQAAAWDHNRVTRLAHV
ncbi:hypothetical protein [Pantoea sp. Nvir]|nr:hypothetical protein [Pantoea sp. Nvir]